ncbi:MAG: hypothetical protein JXB18_07950 [Sedimentisphaerales bacterium]|nr:hypothetical protein [Sedimentisphaerales bacterium]
MVRKLIIGIVAAALMALLFWGYLRLTDSKGFPTGQTSSIRDIPDLPEDLQARQIDQTKIIGVNQARYTILDPQTRQVRRIFGFERLVNPGAQSNNWQVLKPYMYVFEDRFRCRMDADKGDIQVEDSGSTPIPQDAQLTGKVVIRLLPAEGQKFTETVILLDDLNYSSERSEFFTNGPVELISAQARLVGKGMLMMHNPANGRIEYFQIKDLEYLRLKNAVASKLFGSESGTKAGTSDAVAAKAETADKPAPAKPVDSDTMAASGTASTEPNSTDMLTAPLLYQCALRDNVEIHYARQAIIKGAQEITILNMLFGPQPGSGASNEPVTQQPAATAEPAAATDHSPETLLEGELPWDQRASLPDVQPDDDTTDVIVTCDGGIVVKPMDSIYDGKTAISLDVQVTGRPLLIQRLDTAAGQAPYTMVQCQSLQYNPSQEVLKLFVGEFEKTVRLNMSADGGYLETTGNVLWDRKSSYALVDGPGRMVFEPSGGKTESADKPGTASLSGPAQVTFGQKMDVFFAQATSTAQGEIALAAVNLAGGMKAVMKNSSTLRTQAESARLEFNPGNQLARVELNGDVQFASEAEQGKSQAQADKAVLSFAAENTLSMADFKGHVAFDSEQGTFTSGDATIQFAKNESGQLEPVVLTSTTEAVMVSKSDRADQKPARFEAQRIDYELSKGSAVAQGPVVFTFFTPADANDPGSSLPVTITAQKNAEFITGSGKSIQQVVFNGSVIGDATEEKPQEKTIRRFYGDKLTVDLGTDADGRTTISHVAVTDGNVRLEARRFLEQALVSHVKLSCVRFDYDHATRMIAAAGPGKIELNNQDVANDPNTQAGSLDLRQPCYALVEGFKTLTWKIPQQQIIALGGDKSLSLGYITMKDGSPDKVTKTQTMQTTLQLAEDAAGRTILSELLAEGGIYLEQVGQHVLAGQKLRYTGADGWVHIEGTDAQPCFVDGVKVPVVDYNLQTGQLKTRLSTTPGAIPVETK